jgi:hypothetical protein
VRLSSSAARTVEHSILTLILCISEYRFLNFPPQVTRTLKFCRENGSLNFRSGSPAQPVARTKIERQPFWRRCDAALCMPQLHLIPTDHLRLVGTGINSIYILDSALPLPIYTAHEPPTHFASTWASPTWARLRILHRSRSTTKQRLEFKLSKLTSVAMPSFSQSPLLQSSTLRDLLTWTI